MARELVCEALARNKPGLSTPRRVKVGRRPQQQQRPTSSETIHIFPYFTAPNDTHEQQMLEYYVREVLNPYMVKHGMIAAGEEGRWTAHDLRRTATTTITRAKPDGRPRYTTDETSWLLSHKAPGQGVTRIYDRYDRYDLKQEMAFHLDAQIRKAIAAPPVVVPLRRVAAA